MLQLIAGHRWGSYKQEKHLGGHQGERASSSSNFHNDSRAYVMALSQSQMMEEQAALLESALGSVRLNTSNMRRCLETPGKLMDALKCAYVDACSLVKIIAN